MQVKSRTNPDMLLAGGATPHTVTIAVVVNVLVSTSEYSFMVSNDGTCHYKHVDVLG